MSKRLLPGNAYFIHPQEGEVIYVPHSHISLVIYKPEKFGLDFDSIKAIYNKYGEKIGVEGRARREIMLNLIDQGFIRIRKYRNHWKVNVKNFFTDRVAENLNKWATEVKRATNEIYIEVIIEQINSEVIKMDLKTLAAYQYDGNPKKRFHNMIFISATHLITEESRPEVSLP